MNSVTPAKDIRAQDLKANTRALHGLLPELAGEELTAVLDVRYGLGGWAREIREAHPESYICGFEMDPETAELAWKDSQVDLVVEPFTEPPYGVGSKGMPFDLVVADFNDVTQKNREDLDRLVGWLESSFADTRFLIFTDICCSKLHLNWRSYGLESFRRTLLDYWKAFDVPGFELETYYKYHSRASTALFSRI